MDARKKDSDNSLESENSTTGMTKRLDRLPTLKRIKYGLRIFMCILWNKLICRKKKDKCKDKD